MVEREFVTRKTIKNAGLFHDRQPRLSHLDIELTERCNNACLHCYINLPEDDSQAAHRELTTLQWKDVLPLTGGQLARRGAAILGRQVDIAMDAGVVAALGQLDVQVA